MLLRCSLRLLACDVGRTSPGYCAVVQPLCRTRRTRSRNAVTAEAFSSSSASPSPSSSAPSVRHNSPSSLSPSPSTLDGPDLDGPQPAAGAAETPAPLPMEPRRKFSLPSQVPSWYAGHMYRAMRSLPSLLARSPPPLIIEARDARLPLSSINPAFEDLLTSMERMAARDAKKGKKGSSSSTSSSSGKNDMEKDADGSPNHRLNDLRAWRQRRLVIYNKADLIDARLHAPLKRAFAETEGQQGHVMFIDSRSDKDVRKVLRWVKTRAADLVEAVSREGLKWTDSEEDGATPSAMGRMSRSAQPRNLSGAFKHTPTPEDGVRLVILGMPNVGKSSLLNALRRVGTGGGKAASTAPEPGHTRKLTGTVRITPKLEKEWNDDQDEQDDDEEERGPRKRRGMRGRGEKIASSSHAQATNDPGIYVYDTPGVMVPFLGSGEHGAEKGVKLAAAAGIKSSLFDAIGLADYLLFRLNLQWAWQWRKWERQGRKSVEPLPGYLEGLPMGKPDSAISAGGMAWGPTNDIIALLERLALRSPGTLSKGGERDLDAAAKFMLDRWRNGKLGSGELDLGCFEEDEAKNGITQSEAGRAKESSRLESNADTADHIRKRTASALSRHYEMVAEARLAGVASSYRPVQGADRASRRAMEKVPWAELQAQHSADQQQRQDSVGAQSADKYEDHDDAVELAWGADETSKSPASSYSPASSISLERSRGRASRGRDDGRDTSSGGGGSSSRGAHRPRVPLYASSPSTSPLLSKHQAKRRQRAIELVIRESRLREKGVPVRGLLPANRLQAKSSSFSGRRRLRGSSQ